MNQLLINFSYDPSIMVMSDERRHYPRRRVFKGASILLESSAVATTVRSLSLAGATLDIATALGIPTDFVLAIPDYEFTGHCRVVWRNNTRLGIAFEQPMSASG